MGPPSKKQKQMKTLVYSHTAFRPPAARVAKGVLAREGREVSAKTSQSEAFDARRGGIGQETPRPNGTFIPDFDGAGGCEQYPEQSARCAMQCVLQPSTLHVCRDTRQPRG